MNRSTIVSLAVAGQALAACMVSDVSPTEPTDGELLGSVQQDLLTPPTITQVVDQGSAAGRHYFNIQGSFPRPTGACSAVTWDHPPVNCYRVQVHCNGALLPGLITSMTGPAAPSPFNSIQVSIPERPSLSRCSATVAISTHTGAGGAAETAESAEWALSGTISPPWIEIHGVNDVGVTSGFRYFELYGYFPVGANYQPWVRCDGTAVSATITTPNNPSIYANQINVRIPHVAGSRSCEFKIIRLNDNGQTPIWYQRVGGARAAIDSRLGAYLWGGFEPDWLNRGATAKEGVRRLKDAGVGKVFRFVMTPRARFSPPNNSALITRKHDYYDMFSKSGGTIAPCPASTPILPCLADSQAFRQAFSQAGPGATIVLTAMDSASSESNVGGQLVDAARFVDLTWMQQSANWNAVKNEYYQLAKRLLANESGSGRRFIIGNWEGDNLLFCGSSYNFSINANPCPDHNSRRQALTLWFQARKAGIDLAVSEAGPNPGVYVEDAIEFNAYRHIQNLPGMANKDVLHGIIPTVGPRYALYSAWESVYGGTLDQDSREISQYLTTHGSTQLAVGELGVERMSVDPLARWIFKESVRATLRSSASFGVVWEAFPATGLADGLLTVDGAETSAMTALREGAQPPGYIADPVPVIRGVREAPRQATVRAFELYGTFGSGNNAVWAKCSRPGVISDTFSQGTVLYQSSGQINVSVPAPDMTTQMWCVFYVFNTTYFARSHDFGPVHSCASGPCNPAPIVP
jgi:hypothetical protein